MDYSFNYSLVTSDFTDVNNGSISVWDGQTGVNLITLTGNKLSNKSIAIIKDTVVACVENKALLEIWRLSTEGKKKIIPLPAPAKAIFYYEALNILTCFLGFDVYMWQPETGQLLTILGKIHSHPGSQILFTSKNNVITIDESGLIAFWKINLNEFCDVIWKSRPFGNCKLWSVIIEEKDQLFVISESGKFIILSLYDGHASSELEDLRGLNVHCIERHSNTIFIGCNKGTLIVYSINTRTIINRIAVRDSSDTDHIITQLALTPDHKSFILIVDNRTALTYSFDDDFIPKKHFTVGLNVNSLLTVNKSSDMFPTDNDPKKIVIKRLNFSLEQASTNTEIEIQLNKRERSTNEIINQLDSSGYQLFNQLQSSNKRFAGRKTKLNRNLFIFCNDNK